jgi:MFS family permease
VSSLKTFVKERLGVNTTVLAISVARLGDAIGNSILIIVIPLYVAKLPAPWFPFPQSVRVGILISLFGLMNAILHPVLGAVSDSLGRRKPLIMAGLLVMGVAVLAFTWVSRFASLFLLRGLQGIGASLTIPASMALMASATEKQSRGGSMGVYSAMRMVGFAVGPLLGGFLHEIYGFNATFYAGFGFILLGLIVVMIYVHEKPVEVDESERPPFRIIDRDLLGAGILGAGLATFIMASDFSMISALENNFNARLNQTAIGFGIAFSALIVSRLIFQIPLGWLSDRIGRRPLIIVGLILMAPATAFLGEVTTTFQFTWLRVAQGLASAAIAAPAFALAGDLSTAGGEGRQMSIITMGFMFGIAVGPLLAGFLAVLSFSLPFWVGGALSLVIALVVYHYVPETVQSGGSASGQPEAGQSGA